MKARDVDPAYIEERLDAICDGLREGIRREVRRLRRLGLPVVVSDNGKVVSRPSGSDARRDESSGVRTKESGASMRDS